MHCDKSNKFPKNLWTKTGSIAVPNYILGKAKLDFDPATIDVFQRMNKNGVISIKSEILCKSSDMREYDNDIIRE